MVGVGWGGGEGRLAFFLNHVSTHSLWKLWCKCAESYLATRASKAGIAFHQQLCFGRGQVKFKKQRATRQQTQCSAAADTMRVTRLAKLASLLRFSLVYKTALLVVAVRLSFQCAK